MSTQSQAPQQEQAPTSAEVSHEESSSETAASGSNQAAVEDAGIPAEPGAGCSELDGPCAGVILDGYPPAEAVALAEQHLDNPAVIDWAAAMAEQDAAEAVEGHPDLAHRFLDAVWPVGLGVQTTVAVGGDLVGSLSMDGLATVLRTGPDAYSVASEVVFSLSYSPLSASATAVDAFGNGVSAGAGVKATATLRCRFQSALALSPVELLVAAGLAGPVVASVAVIPGAPQLLPELAERLLDQVKSVTQTAELVVGGEASAQAHFESIDVLPPQVSAVVGGVLAAADAMLDGAVPDGDEHHEVGGAGAAAAAYGLAVSSDGVATFRYTGQLSGLVSGMLQLEAHLPGDIVAEVKRMGALGAAVAVAVDMRFQLPDSTDFHLHDLVDMSFEVTSTVTTTRDGGTATETETSGVKYAWIGDFVTALQASSGDDVAPGVHSYAPLAEVAERLGGAPTDTETTAVTLDPALIAGFLPDWADALGLDGIDHAHVGALAADAELKLTGASVVDPDDFERAADAGFMVRSELAGTQVWPLVAGVVRQVRAGSAAPAEVQSDAGLQAAFSGEPRLETARVTGFVGVGVGGELSGSAGPAGSGGGEAAATVRLVVDTPAEGAVLEALERAAAS